MRGDFSRDSFDPAQHFSRVLIQQGRVQLDADANEQVAILLHYLRTLAADLIGPHGGPQDNTGFAITLKTETPGSQNIVDLAIGSGHYYVDGILCENEALKSPDPAPLTEKVQASGRKRARTKAAAAEPAAASPYVGYYNQPDPFVTDTPDPFDKLPLLVYLDVWERLLTATEAPDIRDPALGANGPDTAARAKVVWQVRVAHDPVEDYVVDNQDNVRNEIKSRLTTWFEQLQPQFRGLLAAQTQDGTTDDSDVCILPPESRYRGEENQLYRVEIHTGGTAEDASFKWSRDNGAMVFPIEPIESEAKTVVLASLGRDLASSLQVGDYVEIVDDVSALSGTPTELIAVEAIDPIERVVTLAKAPSGDAGRDRERHPLLRRWDHQPSAAQQPAAAKRVDDGALPVVEDSLLTLEDGVQIRFEPGAGPAAHTYRRGDYWLIPARTATGDVIWPQQNGKPLPRPPHGVEHHYAPLALVTAFDTVLDLRNPFPPLVSVRQELDDLKPA
jgi:hypothetical protein